MKCQSLFSGKEKKKTVKNIIKMWSVESALKAVKAKVKSDSSMHVNPWYAE